MNIAIFSECYHPVRNGVVTSIDVLSRGLAAGGHTVHIFAPGNSYTESEVPRMAGIRFHRLPELIFPEHPFRLASPFFLSLRFSRLFSRLNIDIVHCQHPFTVGRLGCKLARKHGIPSVYTAHSNYVTMAEMAPHPLLRRAGRWLARHLVQQISAHTHYVIVPSRGMGSALLTQLPEKRQNLNVRLVPTGVPPLTPTPGGRVAIRERLGFRPNDLCLLYVGRLGPEKRIDLLLNAVALLRHSGRSGYSGQPQGFESSEQAIGENVRLVLVGDGQMRAELERQASELGIRDILYFAGAMAREATADWYSAADLFVSPAPYESQGLVLIEAMQMGVPCVAVGQGGTTEILEHEVNGLLSTLDASSLAEAMARLLSDSELRSLCVAGTRETLLQFSPEMMIDRVLTIYREALEL